MERNLSFETGQLADIAVRLAWAQIEIFADDVEKIQVLAAGDENSVRDLKIEAKESELLVEQPQYGISLNLMDSRWMQVCVRVPRGWNKGLYISTIGGLLSARGLEGAEIALETVTGDLRANKIKGSALSLKSVSGDVRGNELEAPRLTYRTVSGDVSVDLASSQSVKGTTVSGEQRLSLVAPCDRMELRSVSGDVIVTSPMERANVTLRSVSGRISTEGVSITEDSDAPIVRVTGVSADFKLIAQHQ